MKRFLLLLGLLGGVVAVVVLGSLMQRDVASVSNDCIREGDASKPILRMELARNADDVQCVLGAKKTDADKARWKDMASAQYLDFWFIGAYVALFLAAAVANAGTPAGRARWLWGLVWLAVVVTLAAGIADVFEDRAILNVIENAADAANVRWWALCKWCLIASAVMLEGAIVVLRERGSVLKLWFFSLLGSFAMAAGALCLWAIYGQKDSVIETHITLSFVAFFPLLICAIVESARLRSDTGSAEGARRLATVGGSSPPASHS